MKVTISLPAADIEFLDTYARHHAVRSRSGAIARAIRLLRVSDLGDAYEEAWTEWAASEDAVAWNGVVADGLRGP